MRYSINLSHTHMYNKLFTKILDSSIWLEPPPTRLVWLTFIAVMDEEGYCQFASVANLAHRARVTLEEAKEAVKCLEGPDENSSDPDHEGRRVERVSGGWIVLNASKYRELVTRQAIREKTRERVARFRERKRKESNDYVTHSNGLVMQSGEIAGSVAKAKAHPPKPKPRDRESMEKTEMEETLAELRKTHHLP